MSFTDFFKRSLQGYFILVTGISVAIAILGMSYYPNQILRYDSYFSPLLFAAAGTLPSFILFSRKELSFRQMLFRKILHFLLLEVIQLTIGYATGLIADFGMAVALSLTVFFVYLFKTLIDWILDSKTAANINSGLKRLQE
jgi:uncharacterized membrane protein required for colicin V production